MAELPELRVLSRQMRQELAGVAIEWVEVRQEKCLNLPVDDFRHLLLGRVVEDVASYGKWLRLDLTGQAKLMVHPGMGADIRYRAPGATWPERYHFRAGLGGGSGFSVRFWWFGHLHALSPGESHAPSQSLGPEADAVGPDRLLALLRQHPRRSVKGIILDQRCMAGIGNAYAHDILFRARLHPRCRAGSLSDSEVTALHRAIVAVLERATALGGVEPDFYGRGGSAWRELMVVGYREGRPCPACGAAIVKLRTGPTSTYICPHCQPAGETATAPASGRGG